MMGAAKGAARRRAAAPPLLLVILLAVTATACAGTATGAGTAADSEELTTIVGLVMAGQFREASASIDAALKPSGLPAATREALEFQRVRMQRMREDFDLTAADVEARVRKQRPDLTDADFGRWDAHGLFEHMYMQVTESLTVDADAVPPGKTIRAWIPYPRYIPGQQEDIRFVTSQPSGHGRLDNFRIAFNDGFSQDFVPRERFFRSDTVDSQRGEVESDHGNLYYDRWSYHFEWKSLPSKQDAESPGG